MAVKIAPAQIVSPDTNLPAREEQIIAVAAVAAAPHILSHANLWRVSDDFGDIWKSLDHEFTRAARWKNFAAPGYWPDADMLPLGHLASGPRPVAAERFGPGENILDQNPAAPLRAAAGGLRRRSGTPARGGGRLGLLFFLLLDFFFLTAIAFGHNDLLAIVEPQLRRFRREIQLQTATDCPWSSPSALQPGRLRC